jgi:hypothetical protein
MCGLYAPEGGLQAITGNPQHVAWPRVASVERAGARPRPFEADERVHQAFMQIDQRCSRLDRHPHRAAGTASTRNVQLQRRHTGECLADPFEHGFEFVVPDELLRERDVWQVRGVQAETL